MEKVFNILERLESEITDILESGYDGKSRKEILDKILNFVQHSLSVITRFDIDIIEGWKKDDKHSFLHFVPFLKNFLLTLNNYLIKVEPSLKHFYTDEIASEIETLNKDIQKSQQELDSDFEKLSLREKEKLERNYNTLKILLKERDELISKKNVMESFNLEEIKEEIKDLTKKTKNLKAKIDPLKAEKAELQASLDNFNKLKNEIESLKSSQEETSALLIGKIGESIEFIKGKHQHWQDNKEVYLNRLEEELDNLTETEDKIKNHLSVLSSYRDSVIKNKEIMEKHFTVNKKIADSIPAVKSNLNFKIERMEEDLKRLDSEISRFLDINQKISDEITRSPISFDYQ
jgi:chromosome segregation ATPase